MTAENFDSLNKKWQAFEDSVSLKFDGIVNSFAKPTSDVENHNEVVIELEREKRRLLEELKKLIPDEEQQNKAKREGIESLIIKAYENSVKKLGDIKMFKEAHDALNKAIKENAALVQVASGMMDADLNNAVNLLNQQIDNIKEATEKAHKNLGADDFFSVAKKITLFLEDFAKDCKKIEFNLGIAKKRHLMSKWNENLKNYNADKEALELKMAEYEALLKILEISNPLSLKSVFEAHEKDIAAAKNDLEDHAKFQQNIDKLPELAKELNAQFRVISENILNLKSHAEAKIKELEQAKTEKLNHQKKAIDLKKQDIANLKSGPEFTNKLEKLKSDVSTKHNALLRECEDNTDDLSFYNIFIVGWIARLVNSEKYENLLTQKQSIDDKLSATFNAGKMLQQLNQVESKSAVDSIDAFFEKNGENFPDDVAHDLKSMRGIFQNEMNYEVDLKKLEADEKSEIKKFDNEISEVRKLANISDMTESTPRISLNLGKDPLAPRFQS